jgi:hypothetical protein
MKFVASREAHACSALCSDNGICQIDTAPQSIEATFTGRHETFQYTKVVLSFPYSLCSSDYFLLVFLLVM